MKLKALAASLAVSTLAITSFTAQAGWSVFADAGQSEFDVEASSIEDIDDSDTYYTFGLGYAFNHNFEVELGYTDFGETSAEFVGSSLSGTTQASGLSLVAVGNWFLFENFALTGKAGLEYIQTDNDSSFGFFDETLEFGADDSSTELLYGAGVKFHFNDALALRANYDIHENIDTISLGLKFYF